MISLITSEIEEGAPVDIISENGSIFSLYYSEWYDGVVITKYDQSFDRYFVCNFIPAGSSFCCKIINGEYGILIDKDENMIISDGDDNKWYSINLMIGGQGEEG